MSRNTENSRNKPVTRRNRNETRNDGESRQEAERAYRSHHRQLLVDILSQGGNRQNSRRRSYEDADEKSLQLSLEDKEEAEEEDSFSHEEYSWVWNDEQQTNDVIFQRNNSEVYFHPDYSCGTAAVRGTEELREGEEHYWEVKLSSAVYGTDMMVGVGQRDIDLTKYKSQFCSIIGKEANSWGISYFGTLHHNGKTREYTQKFERGTVIGCHLDMWKGTLSFYKNGQPLGVAFHGLLGKHLYPMISSTAARTRMKLVCAYTTRYSLQYLCCKELSKNMCDSNEAVKELPLPAGLRRYLGWRMDWVFRLNNPPSSSNAHPQTPLLAPSRKRVRRKTKKKEIRYIDLSTMNIQ